MLLSTPKMAHPSTVGTDNENVPQNKRGKQGTVWNECQVAVTSCTNSSLRTKTSDLQADIRGAGSSPTQQEHKGKQQTRLHVTRRPQLAEILPSQWISQRKTVAAGSINTHFDNTRQEGSRVSWNYCVQISRIKCISLKLNL